MNAYDSTAADPLDGAFSGAWLMDQHFPPTRYVVDGIIPEGFSMLVASPKIGKSWMVLGLAVATATGAPAFGSIPVRPAPVLYLALEDGQKRLQRRLRHMGVTDLPHTLAFITELQHGVLPTIEAFMDRHQDENPLVILDTLGKVMPPARPGQSAYHADYQVSGGLRDLAGRYPGAAIIGVHHTRKQASEDFTQQSSGTQGLTGGADTILVVNRNRNEDTGTLSVTSRDAAEGEYSVTFDSDKGAWTLVGGSLTEAAAVVDRTKAAQGVGDTMTDILEVLDKYPEGMKAADIATLLHMESDLCGRYLRRAVGAGRARKTGRGVYAPVRSDRSVRNDDVFTDLFPEPDTSDATDTPYPYDLPAKLTA